MVNWLSGKTVKCMFWEFLEWMFDKLVEWKKR